MIKHNHPFDWFKLAHYAEAENFNFSDWSVMLSHRQIWRDLNLRYPSKAPDAEKAKFWDTYLADVLPSNIGENRKLPIGWDHEGLLTQPPCIADITVESSKGLVGLVQALRYERQFSNIRILTVNMTAPDKGIKQAFADWLREQRRQSPMPARRRGKPSANFEITDDHLKSWARYKVPAVLDLDFYAQVFGIKPLSHEQLAKLLECDDDYDPKEWGRNARAKAAEAMGCVGVLAAQIQAKTNT